MPPECYQPTPLRLTAGTPPHEKVPVQERSDSNGGNMAKQVAGKTTINGVFQSALADGPNLTIGVWHSTERETLNIVLTDMGREAIEEISEAVNEILSRLPPDDDDEDQPI